MTDFEMLAKEAHAATVAEERARAHERELLGEDIYLMFRLNCYAYKDESFCTDAALWQSFLNKQKIELTPTQKAHLDKIFIKKL